MPNKNHKKEVVILSTNKTKSKVKTQSVLNLFAKISKNSTACPCIIGGIYFTDREKFSMTTQKIGLLIANLGTPDEPTTDAVKRYLKQFLNDARVIDLPKWRWQPLLNTIILPRRSPKVAKLYQAIWTENGSPL